MTTKAAATEKYFRPGQFLFHEGEPSKCMFLIKKGTVAIRKMKGAAYIEIARVYSNEVLGELSFFDHSPRSAAAIALTEVEVVEIDFASLEKIYSAVPPYMKTIIASLAERLRRANDTIRRLQKNLISEKPQVKGKEDGPSASEILEQTEALENDNTGVHLGEHAEDAAKLAGGEEGASTAESGEEPKAE